MLMLKRLSASISSIRRTEMSLSDVALQIAPRSKMEPWSQHNEYSFMTESESPLGTDIEAASLHAFNTFSNEIVVNNVVQTWMLTVWGISDGMCILLQQPRLQPSPRLSGIRWYRVKLTLITYLPWQLHMWREVFSHRLLFILMLLVKVFMWPVIRSMSSHSIKHSSM